LMVWIHYYPNNRVFKTISKKNDGKFISSIFSDFKKMFLKVFYFR